MVDDQKHQSEVEQGMNLLEYSLGFCQRSICQGSYIQLERAVFMQLWISFSIQPSRRYPFQLGIIKRFDLLARPSRTPRFPAKDGLSRACVTLSSTLFCVCIHSWDLRSVSLMSFMVKLLPLLQNLSEFWQERRSLHSLLIIYTLLRKIRLYSSSLLVNYCFSARICFWNSFISSSISSYSCMRRLSRRLSSSYASKEPFSRLNLISYASRLPMVRQQSSYTDLVWLRMAEVSHSMPSLRGFMEDQWG